MLRYEEGVEPLPYQDSIGYWTIGIGHLIDPRKGATWVDGPLSDAGMDKLLESDIMDAMSLLDKNIPWAKGLDPVRYGVLLDMTFQMGIGNAEKGTGLLGFVNTLRYIRDGDYEQAAKNMKQSLWYRQTPNRANRRINEMRTGVYHEYP